MEKMIPLYIMFVLTTLREHGFEGYLVGGCVRDFLMGVAPHDFDITTNANPEQILDCFQGYPTVLTGMKHGTVLVMVEKNPVEITTMRKDGTYSDHRRPDHVEFTRTLQEDLSRRDFTINAIAYSPATGIVDCFGGVQDIQNNCIRCVGNPKTRFEEDALRILRGLRFSATLGFPIAQETATSMEQCAPLIKNISAERIFTEFRKLLMGENVEQVLLSFYRVIAQFIPEILPCVGFDQNNPYHVFDVYQHSVRTVAESVKNEYVRLAMFFHDCGKPFCYTEEDGRGHFYGHGKISMEIAEKVLTRLHVDHKTIAIVTTLIHYHDMQLSLTEKSIRRALQKLGEETFFLLLEVKRADNKGKSPELWTRLAEFKKAEELAKKVLSEHQCVGLKTLQINGNDLIQAGIPEGKMVGQMLHRLLDAVMEDIVPNERKQLLEYVQNHIRKELEG